MAEGQADESTEKEGTVRLRPDREADSEVKAGTKVGRFVVVSELGHGGMGAVYAAFDPHLSRKVAVKLLHAQAMASFPQGEATARLQREAQALAQVSHPNVVAVHDVGLHRGQVFIAMEFVEGENLREWLKGRPVAEVLRALCDAGDGLQAIHAAGLVHRDFKSANVVMAKDGRVKVLDLGLARLSGDATEPNVRWRGKGVSPEGEEVSGPSLDATLTQEGYVSGTPGYLAPELFSGGQATAASDQFSFGVALFQALYGVRPYSGKTFDEYANQLEKGPPQAPPAGSKVPGWLFPIVRRSLAKRPEERFESMEALVRALRADPYAARRRWAIGAAALAVLAAAVWGGARLNASACPTAESLVQELWPSGSWERLEASLSQGHAELRPSIRRGLSTLDRAVRQWAQTREATCQQLEMRGAPEAQARKMACLERRGRQLRIAIDLLSVSELAGAKKVHELITRFAEDPACQHGLDRRNPEDVAPAHAETARRLSTTLFKARALALVDRYTEALQLVHSVVDEAHPAGLLGFEALARLRAGQLENELGNHAAGTELYRDALYAGLAGGIDDVALTAAVRLVPRALRREGGMPEAKELLRLAEALWARLGHSPDLELEVIDARQYVARDEGRIADVVSMAERALVLTRSVYGEYSEAHSTAWADYSWALYNADRYKECPAADLKAVELLRSVVGDEDSQLVWRYDALAESLTLAGREREAVPWVEKALAISIKTEDPEATDIANVKQSLAGLILYDEPQRALSLINEVVARYERAAAPDRLASAYETRSWIWARLGKGSEVMADCDRLERTQAGLSDHQGFRLRDSRRCRGRAALLLGHPQEAVTMFEQALAARPKPKGPSTRVRMALELASALRAVGAPAGKVKEMYDEALREAVDLPADAQVRREIADLQKLLAQPAAEPPTPKRR